MKLIQNFYYFFFKDRNFSFALKWILFRLLFIQNKIFISHQFKLSNRNKFCLTVLISYNQKPDFSGNSGSINQLKYPGIWFNWYFGFIKILKNRIQESGFLNFFFIIFTKKLSFGIAFALFSPVFPDSSKTSWSSNKLT